MGLAVGFVLGATVSQLISSLVNDIINPFMGLFLGSAGNLSDEYVMVGSAKVMWGHFLSVFIDFLIISIVIYLAVSLLKISPKKK